MRIRNITEFLWTGKLLVQENVTDSRLVPNKGSIKKIRESYTAIQSSRTSRKFNFFLKEMRRNIRWDKKDTEMIAQSISEKTTPLPKKMIVKPRIRVKWNKVLRVGSCLSKTLLKIQLCALY
jgi:hypothetical protein